MKRIDERLNAEMEGFLRERLGEDLRLLPFETQSAKVVFRAEIPAGNRRFFVKLTSRRKGEALRNLTDELDLPFVAKVAHLFPWDEKRCVICQEWQTGRHVKPEDMTDAQCASLVAATRRLQNALKPHHAILPMLDVGAAYATVKDFARRHPLMRPLLRSLLDIPEDERTLPEDALAVIHGDQHYENYLFDGDHISAIMDFEAVTKGLRTQDFAYIVARRLFKARLPATKRARLSALLAMMFDAFAATRRERIVSVNIWRIVFAARRLASHPHFGPVALLVWKRDRPLRTLLADCSA